MEDTLHILGDSTLKNLGIGMVSQFPLDFMQLVCLGVVKRLLGIWIKGPIGCRRLAPSAIRRISDHLLNLGKHLPREFLRKGRFDVDRWKAAEFRQF